MSEYLVRAFRGAQRLREGKPLYDQIDGIATLAEARAAAARLHEDRPVAIYEIVGGLWRHVENWEPARPFRLRREAA